MASNQFPITNFLGTQAFGPVNVPAGLTRATIALDGTNMTDPAMLGSLTLDLSLDSGVTWASDNPSIDTNPFPCVMTFQGGAMTVAKPGKPSVPLPFYDLNCDIPHSELTTRRVKGVLTVAGVALTTTATLTTA